MRMITTAALALLLCACANQDKAEKLAREYAVANYPGHAINNVACQSADSDGDGYCACNVSMTTPKGDVIVPPLECSCGWAQIWHNGCRFPKASLGRAGR